MLQEIYDIKNLIIIPFNKLILRFQGFKYEFKVCTKNHVPLGEGLRLFANPVTSARGEVKNYKIYNNSYHVQRKNTHLRI